MDALHLSLSALGVHSEKGRSTLRLTFRYRVFELSLLALLFVGSAVVTLDQVSLSTLGLALPVAATGVIMMSLVGAYRALSQRLCISVALRSAVSLALLAISLGSIHHEHTSLDLNARFLFFFPFLSFFVLQTLRPLATALAEPVPGDRRRKTIASSDVVAESAL